MREIAGSENPHADKQAAEVNRERLQSEQEGTLRGGGQGPFAHQQPEACHGDEARKERPEKNLAIGMIGHTDRKSTRLNSSHSQISYAVFCLKKKTTDDNTQRVVHIARAHLVLELQRQDGTDFEWFHLVLYSEGIGSSCWQSV